MQHWLLYTLCKITNRKSINLFGQSLKFNINFILSTPSSLPDFIRLLKLDHRLSSEEPALTKRTVFFYCAQNIFLCKINGAARLTDGFLQLEAFSYTYTQVIFTQTVFEPFDFRFQCLIHLVDFQQSFLCVGWCENTFFRFWFSIKKIEMCTFYRYSIHSPIYMYLSFVEIFNERNWIVQ